MTDVEGNLALAAWRNPTVWYVYLGGIAAGTYVLACLALVVGPEADRRATRASGYLTFPVVVICIGLYLLLPPLSRHRDALSARPTALLAVAVMSLGSLLAVLVEDGWIGFAGWKERLARLRRSWLGKVIRAVGGVLAVMFAVSASLRVATGWASTTWLGAVCLASAAATGASALVVLDSWLIADVNEEAMDRLSQAVGWVVVVELAMLTALSLSLRGLSGLAFQRWPGMLVPLFVVPVGLVVPLLIRQARGAAGAVDASLLVLLGGFVLQASLAGIPASLDFR